MQLAWPFWWPFEIKEKFGAATVLSHEVENAAGELGGYIAGLQILWDFFPSLQDYWTGSFIHLVKHLISLLRCLWNRLMKYFIIQSAALTNLMKKGLFGTYHMFKLFQEVMVPRSRRYLEQILHDGKCFRTSSTGQAQLTLWWTPFHVKNQILLCRKNW